MDTPAIPQVLGGGAPVGQASALCQLFTLTGANLNSTADQQFTKTGAFAKYLITHIVARGISGDALIAAGGIYPAASKAGTAIVAAGQLWAAISAADKVLALTLAALASAQTATPYLSLTTAAGAAATADVLIFGLVLA
jgi:hypothetical protein